MKETFMKENFSSIMLRILPTVSAMTTFQLFSSHQDCLLKFAILAMKAVPGQNLTSLVGSRINRLRQPTRQLLFLHLGGVGVTLKPR